jgi:hypothetical protein
MGPKMRTHMAMLGGSETWSTRRSPTPHQILGQGFHSAPINVDWLLMLGATPVFTQSA